MKAFLLPPKAVNGRDHNSQQLEMKNNWNHLCRGMPRRQELDTWRAGQRRTRTCDVTQECEKLNYSDQLTVINEASVQCQDCQGAGLAAGSRSTCLAN